MGFIDNYMGRDYLNEIPESSYDSDGRMARTYTPVEEEEEKEEEIPQTEVPETNPLMSVLSGAGLYSGLKSAFGGSSAVTGGGAPVASAAMADGSAGTMLKDGSVVATSGSNAAPVVEGGSATTGSLSYADGAGYAITAYNLYDAMYGKNYSRPTDSLGAIGAVGGAAVGYWFGGPLGAAAGSYLGKTAGRDIGTAFDDDTRLSKQDRKLYGLAGPGPGWDLIAIDKLSQVFGSGKSPQQKERDLYRSYLKEYNMLDDDYMLKMYEGQQYNLGREIDPTAGFRTYETRQDRPFQAAVIGFVNPLAYILTGGDEFTPQLANQLANAASNTANDLRAAYRNVLTIYRQTGLTPDQMRELVDTLHEDGKIDDHTKAVFHDTLDQLSGERDPNLDDTWAAQQPIPESWEMTDARKKQEEEANKQKQEEQQVNG